MEGCVEGRGDGLLLGTVEVTLEVRVTMVGYKDGLGGAEEADDGHVFPIGIDISSKVKLPPS